MMPAVAATCTCTCTCTCLGCRHFHLGAEPVEGQDAHHNRLLLALDRSIAAAFRARGVAACDGLDDSEPCEVGTLHSRTAQLAIALATVIESPSGGDPDKHGGTYQNRAINALEALFCALETHVAGRPVLS
jgi:hypothetical protein